MISDLLNHQASALKVIIMMEEYLDKQRREWQNGNKFVTNLSTKLL